MEKIILKQYSPIIVLESPSKSGDEKKYSYEKPESKGIGIGWIIAGVIVLIIVIYAIVVSLKKKD
jgi:hypothetical protein